MKKIIIVILAILLVINLIGCGSSTTDETEASNTIQPSTLVTDMAEDTGNNVTDTVSTIPVGTKPSGENEYSIEYNGVTISLHAPAADIVVALGEPMSYTEQASCAFEGLDKTYYYGSFYLVTYPMGEEDFVYGFWFADDSLATTEGIYIGSSQADVEAAYGAETYNGENAFILHQGDGTLTILLDERIVTSIQYAINLQ